MASPRPQSIPVFLLIKTAFQILWQQRDDALRLGFVPTLICFAGLVYGEDGLKAFGAHFQSGIMNPLPPGVALSVMSTLLVVLLAMALAAANWLRFMLLGPMGAVGLGLAIGRPHVSFLAWCLLLGFASAIAFIVISFPVLLLPRVFAGVGMFIAFIVVLVVTTRLLPFLVGQVIAQPMSLQQSWLASRGNGISLATALILVQIPVWIFASVLSQILFAIGFATAAPLAMVFIAAVLQIAMAILQTSILAAAFRQIVGIRA
jgi:hypothetical protein